MNEILALCLSISVLGMTEAKNKRVCGYLPEIVKSSKKRKIEPELLISLIFVESSFDRRAVSYAGACGLTQVMPKYTGGPALRKKLTCKQLKNPRISIRSGAKILSWWIKHHKGNISQALCGYNAGFRCSYRKNKKGKIVKRPNKYGMRYAKKVLKFSKKIKTKKNSFLNIDNH